MLVAKLFRYEYGDDYTRGALYVDGHLFYTIEQEMDKNARNDDCIPKGRYTVEFLPQSLSGKYKNCWWVKNVPNRSGILIHNGNLAKHSLGCIILGSVPGTLHGQPAVLSSRRAMRKLFKVVGDQSFILDIM